MLDNPEVYERYLAERALAINPKDATARIALAHAALEQKDMAAAALHAPR